MAVVYRELSESLDGDGTVKKKKQIFDRILGKDAQTVRWMMSKIFVRPLIPIK